MECESHSFPFINGVFESGVIILSIDSKMKESYGESLLDEAFSMITIKSQFLVKSDGGENIAEGTMPPTILIEEEIKVDCRMRENACHFFKT